MVQQAQPQQTPASAKAVEQPQPQAEATQPAPQAQQPAPAPQPQPRTPDREYYYGTGKRKSAIARVRIYPVQGGAQVTINKKSLEEAFPFQVWQLTVLQPLQVTKLRDRFTVTAEVDGGGVSAQAGAVRHGISRALAIYDPGLKTELRKFGLLTRDPRVKERKKYGLKRARRAPQYTKR